MKRLRDSLSSKIALDLWPKLLSLKVKHRLMQAPVGSIFKSKLTYSKPFEVHFCQLTWRQELLRVIECIWRIRGYPDTLLHPKESSSGLWNFA